MTDHQCFCEYPEPDMLKDFCKKCGHYLTWAGLKRYMCKRRRVTPLAAMCDD